MTEEEINQKLEQANKDKASIEANIVELEKQKADLPKRWIAAKSDNRLILNLSALSVYTKCSLSEACEDGYKWISFCENGRYCACSKDEDGLTTYNNTEIIFGENGK